MACCDRAWPHPGSRFAAGPRSGLMRIVVTTPTGNIGSRVVQLLLQAGAPPTLFTPDPPRLDSPVLERADVLPTDLPHPPAALPPPPAPPPPFPPPPPPPTTPPPP